MSNAVVATEPVATRPDDPRLRLLAIFIAGSAVAHAAMFGVLPRFLRDREPPPVVLEVTLTKPEPLPIAPPEPEKPLPPVRKHEPQRTREPAPAAAKKP